MCLTTHKNFFATAAVVVVVVLGNDRERSSIDKQITTESGTGQGSGEE